MKIFLEVDMPDTTLKNAEDEEALRGSIEAHLERRVAAVMREEMAKGIVVQVSATVVEG